MMKYMDPSDMLASIASRPSSIGMLVYIDLTSMVTGKAFTGMDPFSFSFSRNLRKSGVSSINDSRSLTLSLTSLSTNHEIRSVLEPHPGITGRPFGICCPDGASWKASGLCIFGKI